MSEPRDPRKRAHRLLCRCPSCGFEKFFGKFDTSGRFFCDSCKQRTPIEPTRAVFLSCPGCGYHTSFETNLGEDLITITCHGCGYPIDFEHSQRREAYVPISDTGPGRQRKRGSRRH